MGGRIGLQGGDPRDGSKRLNFEFEVNLNSESWHPGGGLPQALGNNATCPPQPSKVQTLLAIKDHRYSAQNQASRPILHPVGTWGESKTWQRRPWPGLAPDLNAYLPALMGPHLGPDPRPTPQQTGTGQLGFGKFLFSFPTHFRVGVFFFSKTQTHLLTKREKKVGEQGREVTPTQSAGNALAPAPPGRPPLPAAPLAVPSDVSFFE